ncbi:hypothetical protein AK812_SmicGene29882 [Symbiodinium microadriaticum]|uniref:Uncharacterized protein n=1 Tax=Symbiodinium microadriaticum TaxID=2951 RepID=A0A1Q9D0S5_SYMMI|nr:hypothetical protein AK812_SmicGene29882 [Symbiodinium microadriaticum]
MTIDVGAAAPDDIPPIAEEVITIELESCGGERNASLSKEAQTIPEMPVREEGMVSLITKFLFPALTQTREYHQSFRISRFQCDYDDSNEGPAHGK